MGIPCTTKAPKMVCFCCHHSYDGKTCIKVQSPSPSGVPMGPYFIKNMYSS